MQEKKSIVITGVSSGIGYATVKVLIQNGFHVFGSLRKKTDADALAKEFGDSFTPLFFDITDTIAIQAAAKQVREKLNGCYLCGLVNNAGMGDMAPFLLMDLDKFRRVIEVNLMGTVNVTHAFAPLLGIDPALDGPSGRIVNISSMAGKLPLPFGSSYTAAKHALDGFSDTLRIELMPYGIDVIVVAPGPGGAKSKILDTLLMNFEKKYLESDYGPALSKMKYDFENWEKSGGKIWPAERVGKVILDALTLKHPKDYYAVMPKKFFMWTLPRLLPKRWLAKLVAKQLGINERG